jgi:SAM-dependent methyltransferase
VTGPPPCPVCAAPCPRLGAVDFNKCCEETRGRFLPRSGVAVWYFRCEGCGFCFAPEICNWTRAEFERRIYNEQYAQVDPDFGDARPRANAASLIAMFGAGRSAIRHLDYGGGSGLLSRLMREAGWRSVSYDPFHDEAARAADLGRFDLVTAYEVFEHAPDVNALISDLGALRAPSGIVLFTTQLSDGNIGERRELTWWYASPRNGHISLFSRKSLQILAGREGLRFASFSAGAHALWRTAPPWATHVLRSGPGRARRRGR